VGLLLDDFVFPAGRKFKARSRENAALTRLQDLVRPSRHFSVLEQMIQTYLVNDNDQLPAATTTLTEVPRRDQLQVPFFVDDIE